MSEWGRDGLGVGQDGVGLVSHLASASGCSGDPQIYQRNPLGWGPKGRWFKSSRPDLHQFRGCVPGVPVVPAADAVSEPFCCFAWEAALLARYRVGDVGGERRGSSRRQLGREMISGFHPICTWLVPLWYRMHRPMSPERPGAWTWGTQWTLRDGSARPIGPGSGLARSIRGNVGSDAGSSLGLFRPLRRGSRRPIAA